MSEIFVEDRPLWVAKDEISFATEKEKIQQINEWYLKNRDEILRDINNEMEELE